MEMQEKKSGWEEKKHKKPEDPNAYKDRDIIRVQLSEDAKAFKTLLVNLLATNEKKQEMILPMKATTQDSFAYEIDEFALPAAGKYEMKAVVLATGAKGKTVQEMTAPIEYTKKASSEGEQVGEAVFVEEKKPPAPPSRAIPILLMTFVNCVAGFFGYMLLKKVQSGAAETMPAFTPISLFSAGIEGLRSRSQQVEINLDDPRFEGAIPHIISDEVASPEGQAPPEEEEISNSAVEGEEKSRAVTADVGDIDAELTSLLSEDVPDQSEEPQDDSSGEKEGEGAE